MRRNEGEERKKEWEKRGRRNGVKNIKDGVCVTMKRKGWGGKSEGRRRERKSERGKEEGWRERKSGYRKREKTTRDGDLCGSEEKE